MTNEPVLNNKYIFKTNLGADSSGYFFLTEDLATKRPYYTKLIRIDNEKISAKELYFIQLRMQKLSRFSHPGAIPVYEPELAEEGLLLRQKQLAGESLAALLQRNGRPAPFSTGWSIAYAVVSALALLHNEGMTHGQVDPSHILISESGEVSLSFLPLPPLFDRDSAFYHAPAAAGILPSTFAEDVFSMGVVLAELFTSLTPYHYLETKPSDDVDEATRMFAYYREGLKKAADSEAGIMIPLIQRCLTDQPAQRYPDCEALYWDLHHLAEDHSDRLPLPIRETAVRPEEKKATLPEFEISEKKHRKHARRGKAPLLFFLTGGFLLFAALFLIFRPEVQKDNLPLYRETLNVLHITQTALLEEGSASGKSLLPSSEPSATPEPTATQTLTPAPLPITREIGAAVSWRADQSMMVYVPEGEFTMGADTTFLFSLTGTLPQHQVKLDGFWIDLTEVTQKQYAKCVNAGVCAALPKLDENVIGDSFPILNVSWNDASAYCEWAGKRLPSEAEWEKAARGTDRRIYPWGNSSPDLSTPDIGLPNTAIQMVGTNLKDVSPYGVTDMAGNVSEWVNDYYSDTRVITDEMYDPVGPLDGTAHTVKGGNAGSVEPELVGLLYRRWGSDPAISQQYGFRCVVSDTKLDAGSAEMLAGKATLAKDLGYTLNSPDCEDKAGFVSDVTIPDGTSLEEGEWVMKTWLLKNVGTCPWNRNYKVLWEDETIYNAQKMSDINVNLLPGEEAEVSVSFRAEGQGRTRIGFILANSDGKVFGLGERGRGKLWVEYVIP